jgi:hypothetical protein
MTHLYKNLLWLGALSVALFRSDRPTRSQDRGLGSRRAGGLSSEYLVRSGERRL